MCDYDMLLQGTAQFLQSGSSSFPSDDASPRCRDFSALFQSLTSSSSRSLPPPRRDRFARWQTCVPADKSGRRRRWACRVESTFRREPTVNPSLINELKIKGRAVGGSGTGREKRCKNSFRTTYTRRSKCFRGDSRQLARWFWALLLLRQSSPGMGRGWVGHSLIQDKYQTHNVGKSWRIGEEQREESHKASCKGLRSLDCNLLLHKSLINS